MTENKPWLGTLSTFAEAYPEVHELRFAARERGEFSDSYSRRTGRDYRDIAYSRSDIPGRIPCSNPRCQQGGYDLNSTLMAITGSRQATYEADWSCGGHEGTPGGRRIGDPCMNSLSFKVELTYRGSS